MLDLGHAVPSILHSQLGVSCLEKQYGFLKQICHLKSGSAMLKILRSFSCLSCGANVFAEFIQKRMQII
jgi:hypothetical protein